MKSQKLTSEIMQIIYNETCSTTVRRVLREDNTIIHILSFDYVGSNILHVMSDLEEKIETHLESREAEKGIR